MRSCLTFLFFSVLTSIVTQSAIANDLVKNWGRGFVEIDNQFPLALNHNSFRPMSPEVKPKGESSLRFTYAISNNYILVKKKYRIDGEYRIANINYRYSIFDNLELGANIPLVWRGGGNLDSFVDEFHKKLGFPRGERRGKPKNKFGIYGLNKDDSAFGLNKTGSEIGDLTLSAKYLLTSGNIQKPAWSILSEIRLPTATEESYGQDSVDITLGVIGSKSYMPWSFYWGGAYLYYADTFLRNIEYKRHHFEGFLGVEYEFSEKLSFNVATYIASDLMESIQMFPEYAIYLDTGLKYEITPKNIFEFLLRENPYPSKGTADFSVIFGVQHSF